MSQLYDKMAEGTLLVVVCQGAVTSMVNLSAKRIKSKWDATSKERMDTIAGKKRDHSQSKRPTRQPYPTLPHPENACFIVVHTLQLHEPVCAVATPTQSFRSFASPVW